MIAYKGFTEDLTSVFGNGRKEDCTFRPGQTMMTADSKTARNGFHCTEYIFDCMTWYPMDGRNRHFKVEAAGNIDEDETGRIACTEITLLKELKPIEIAMAGMEYMIRHPYRDGWQQRHTNVVVAADEAEAAVSGAIAISRGLDPMVKGPAGSILGLITEDETGIRTCKLIVQSEELADRWCRLSESREVEAV